MDDVLSPADAAELAGCSEEQIEDRARRGTVAAIKWGRSWRFPRAAYLESLNDAARQNLAIGQLVSQSRRPGRPRET